MHYRTFEMTKSDATGLGEGRLLLVCGQLAHGALHIGRELRLDEMVVREIGTCLESFNHRIGEHPMAERRQLLRERLGVV